METDYVGSVTNKLTRCHPQGDTLLPSRVRTNCAPSAELARPCHFQGSVPTRPWICS